MKMNKNRAVLAIVVAFSEDRDTVTSARTMRGLGFPSAPLSTHRVLSSDRHSRRRLHNRFDLYPRINGGVIPVDVLDVAHRRRHDRCDRQHAEQSPADRRATLVWKRPCRPFCLITRGLGDE